MHFRVITSAVVLPLLFGAQESAASVFALQEGDANAPVVKTVALSNASLRDLTSADLSTLKPSADGEIEIPVYQGDVKQNDLERGHHPKKTENAPMKVQSVKLATFISDSEEA